MWKMLQIEEKSLIFLNGGFKLLNVDATLAFPLIFINNQFSLLFIYFTNSQFLSLLMYF